MNKSLDPAGTRPIDGATLRLRAGPTTMFFEPENVFLRRLCCEGKEILRGIYAAVRDHNWGTVTPRIADLQSTIGEDCFELRFGVDCRQAGIDFHWHGEIAGQPDGTVSFDFDGEARSTFLRNRIGFCVLHPRECAGAAAEYERTDGQKVHVQFATAIEPQLVGEATFREMRSLAYQVTPDLRVELEFQGDAFEMEDQRNWTDASFKTYCTPLALPFPVEVSAGTRIRQRVRLSLRRARELAGSVAGTRGGQRSTIAPGALCEDGNEQSQTTEVSFDDSRSFELPRLGLGISSQHRNLTSPEVRRLARLRLSHLRADVQLGKPGWPGTLERAAGQARQLGCKLELALHLPATEPDPGATETLDRFADILDRVLILRTGEPATSAASLRIGRRLCGRLPSAVRIGGGTDAHFCELNREQALGKFGLAEAEFLSWPVTPQVHTFDNLSILETLEAQPDTVVTARGFAGQKPLAISPITLKPRFNAVAVGEEHAGSCGDLPPSVDVRQTSLFAAAWTLGSFGALAGAGVASLTYYETAGWRGIMGSEESTARPEVFPSEPGTVFPTYFVCAALAGFDRGTVCIRTGKVAALRLLRPESTRVVIADLSGTGLSVRLLIDCKNGQLWALDQTAVAQARRSPEAFLSQPGLRVQSAGGKIELKLPAHALAWLDLGR